MKTTHEIIFENSSNIDTIPSNNVGLVVTSPPYPMVSMWDEMFSKQNQEIKDALEDENGALAFELMHQELDKVWNEVYRVLIDGGIACINIGDATRKIGGIFQLFSNHTRILNHCLNIGFVALPDILWRKTTNSPNKFMGSGMLPASAYVTLEHEYILILRKGNKRIFKPEEKLNRRKSSFFWEERNIWFSDIWDLKGISQELNDKKVRKRSAAYPFELAFRLINMYSVKDDVVLDPYLGTGTTTIAAMASGRNSIGIEIDHNFKGTIFSRFKNVVKFSNEYIKNRIDRHLYFVNKRAKTHGKLKYKSKRYDFPVMTKQEVEMNFHYLEEIKQFEENCFKVIYADLSREEFAEPTFRSQDLFLFPPSLFHNI